MATGDATLGVLNALQRCMYMYVTIARWQYTASSSSSSESSSNSSSNRFQLVKYTIALICRGMVMYCCTSTCIMTARY
jgi:hypothetical protein